MNSGSNPYSMKSWVVDVLEQFVVHHRPRLGVEPDLPLGEAPRDLLLQALERAAHDKQNVARADRFALRFAAALLEFEGRLELRLQIVRAPQRHVGFFHQLEQRGLHAAPAHVASDQISGRRDLVDLVDVNDAELRELHVAIGLVHQFAHEILDVAADVTGLAELRRVRLHERNFDQLRDVLDQIGFSDAGRARPG